MCQKSTHVCLPQTIAVRPMSIAMQVKVIEVSPSSDSMQIKVVDVRTSVFVVKIKKLIKYCVKSKI